MQLIVDIEKRLGEFKLKTAFEFEKGVMGLLGASGCGKSMTLKCIAGIEKPDRGHIELDGVTLFDSKKHIDVPTRQRSVGYLFQNYALFPNMSVRKNILCGLCREKDRSVKQAEVEKFIRLLTLSGMEDRFPNQLSGGQQQRVALARILVSQPKLIMLDEPFSALDSHLREKLQIEMSELLEQYRGLSLMVTHSRDEAYRLCDHIALMERGCLLTLRPTKHLFADPQSIAAAAMTGCKNIASAVKIGEFEVQVPEWGICLHTAQPVADNLCAVGIRAHYFNTNTPQNRLPITIVHKLEEPFEWIYTFRYVDQRLDTPELWWRMPKAAKPVAQINELGIAAENVLLLYL